jgi:hypothetical protein
VGEWRIAKTLTACYDGQIDPLTLLLAVNSREDAIKAPIRPLDFAQTLEVFKDWLNYVCPGLLEVCHGISHIKTFLQFLNKSAKDFVNQPEIWNNILDNSESSGFDVNASLLSSHLLQIKAWRMSSNELVGTSVISHLYGALSPG